MAKEKKPASGNKSTSGASKDVSAKAKSAKSDTAPVKASDTSPKPVAAVDRKTVKAAEMAKTPNTVAASSIPKTAKSEPVKKPEPVKTAETASSKDTSSKPVEETKPEISKSTPPTPQVKSTPQPEPQKQRSVFWPLVFGGLIAGGIGFAASEMDLLGRASDTDGITQALNAQAERIGSLEAVEMPNLDGLKAGIAAIDETVSGIEARLSELENRPVPTGDGSGPSPEYAQGLAALKSSVEEQKAEISRLLENALSVEEATANAARDATVQSALMTITAALGSGAGFAPAVEELNSSGMADVPAALAENAEGVATLLSLQSSFPDTARAALAAARSTGEGDGGGGVGAFLKRQLGARSVAPREGSDPDAVLSRTEAAVRQGNIADALTEIETLPAAAQDVMADWLASARARAATEAAVQDLSQRLSAN